MMSGSKGSGLLRRFFGYRLLPWRVNQRVVGHDIHASLFVGLTLSTSYHYHVEQVEGMQNHSSI
jgi:hypothetical protein